MGRSVGLRSFCGNVARSRFMSDRAADTSFGVAASVINFFVPSVNTFSRRVWTPVSRVPSRIAMISVGTQASRIQFHQQSPRFSPFSKIHTTLLFTGKNWGVPMMQRFCLVSVVIGKACRRLCCDRCPRRTNRTERGLAIHSLPFYWLHLGFTQSRLSLTQAPNARYVLTRYGLHPRRQRRRHRPSSATTFALPSVNWSRRT